MIDQLIIQHIKENLPNHVVDTTEFSIDGNIIIDTKVVNSICYIHVFHAAIINGQLNKAAFYKYCYEGRYFPCFILDLRSVNFTIVLNTALVAIISAYRSSSVFVSDGEIQAAHQMLNLDDLTPYWS